jgi:hypothetical protein
LASLKEALYPTRGDESTRRTSGIDAFHLIPTTWALLLTESTQIFTPIALKLIQDIALLERSSPLLPEDFVMLYQINQVIQRSVKRGNMPTIFA